MTDRLPSPDEAWRLLLGVAPQWSAMADEVGRAQGELIARGVFQSGPSLESAMRLAARHGYVWDGRRRRFRRRLVERARLPAVGAGFAVAVAAAFLGSLTSSKAALAITAAATAAAAYAALIAVLLQRRP